MFKCSNRKRNSIFENKDFSDKAIFELRAYNTKMYVESREKLLQAQLDLLSHMLMHR